MWPETPSNERPTWWASSRTTRSTSSSRLQGGFGSAQTIPHIDFDVIAANPKPFVGYSDITALHVAIRQRTGLATLYGYGLIGVGDKDRRRSRATAYSTCSRATAPATFPGPDDPYVRAIHGGRSPRLWSAVVYGS